MQMCVYVCAHMLTYMFLYMFVCAVTQKTYTPNLGRD